MENKIYWNREKNNNLKQANLYRLHQDDIISMMYREQELETFNS